MIPNETKERAVKLLQGIRDACARDGELQKMIAAKADVLARFQPRFTQERVKTISADEFREFLVFKNNQHWIALQRGGPAITENLPLLRQALQDLLDEHKPVGERLDNLIPKQGARVKRLGKAILTPILLVAHPEAYGVWNEVSEQALKKLDIMPDVGKDRRVGVRYEAINGLLLELAAKVGVDLWTLDALLWRVVSPASQSIQDDAPVETIESAVAEANDARFGLERHLHDFLLDNWDATELGKEWVLLTEDGDVNGYGSERQTPVGIIDILARHKKMLRFLVVELKRGKTSDVTLGQIQRYRGWVQEHMCKNGESVDGLIIALDDDEKLRYALKVTPSVRFMRYELSFKLMAT